MTRAARLSLLLLLLLATTLSCVRAADVAAVQAFVETAAVQKIVADLVPQIEDGLSGTPIQSIDVKQDGFRVELNNMVLKTVKTSGVTVSTNTSGVAVAMNGISVVLTGHYRIEEDAVGHVKICEGDMSVSAAGATALSFTITISESNGVPVVNTGNVGFNLGSWNLDICGGLHTLIKIFQGLIHDKVQDAVRSQLAPSVNKAAAQAISKLTFKAVVDKVLGVDYHLAGPLVFSPAGALVSILGEVFDPTTNHYSPFTPTAVPTPPETEAAAVSIGQSIFQGAFWSFYTHDMLQVSLAAGKSGLLHDLNISLNVTGLPLINIDPTDGIKLDLLSSAVFNFTLFPEFAFGVDSHVVLDAEALAVTNVNGTFVYLQVPEVDLDSLQFDFILKNHTRLPFDEKELANFLDQVFKTVLPSLNQLLAERVLIPVPVIQHFKFDDIKVAYDQNALTVAANVEPPGVNETTVVELMSQESSALPRRRRRGFVGC